MWKETCICSKRPDAETLMHNISYLIHMIGHVRRALHMRNQTCICEKWPAYVKRDLHSCEKRPTCVVSFLSLLQVYFTGLFYRSLLQVSFTGLFYRSLLQVSFTGLFYRSLLQVYVWYETATLIRSLTSFSLFTYAFSFCTYAGLLCEKRPTCVERDLHMWKERVVYDRRLRLWFGCAKSTSKKPCTCKKRPAYVKRDLYMWKETCICK